MQLLNGILKIVVHYEDYKFILNNWDPEDIHEIVSRSLDTEIKVGSLRWGVCWYNVMSIKKGAVMSHVCIPHGVMCSDSNDTCRSCLYRLF